MKRVLSIITIITTVLCLIAPGMPLADDTEIYGTVSVALPPNVLIIFDTSGSMSTVDVPGDIYDPATTYAGPYPENAVYESSHGGWVLFSNDVTVFLCADVKDALLADGYCHDHIQPSTACGGANRRMRLGNYMNFEEAELGEHKRRIDVAKQVITNIINDTDNVRFGLMRFNKYDGGTVVAECGSDKATLVAAVDNFSPEGYTPLAECLAEAGLYFAGMDSWYNEIEVGGVDQFVDYTSPMQERCQKNYVILMTDGKPAGDTDATLKEGTYINGDIIGDYDGDGREPTAQDYLDDVAKYLYERDCNPTLGTGTSFEKQNIITYTIGFLEDLPLLQQAAGNGGGEYYTAQNTTGLTEAFEEIMSSIAEVSAVFVSPVVPVSRMNRTYAGNYIYVGFFKPQQSGRWLGNVKKYGLDSDGSLLDADGAAAALSDGSIKDNARSYWSFTTDGANVAAGGVGGVVLDQVNRNLYTYMGTQAGLIHSDNQFSTDNDLITYALLNLISEAKRESLINEIHGGDRFWIMGDILHSEPAVIHYDANTTYIFAGSNDGMMHCFDDSDGSEVWGFIPPDQLDRLYLLSNNDHDYFVDGTPTVYQGANQKILFFGERRGGDHYYALDVTTVTAPTWLYKIEPTILGGENLGQSWCKAMTGEIKTSAGSSDTVFLMAGGYDTNQDADTPAASDSLGRAVCTVEVTDGALSSLNYNAGNYADMTHCVVDLSGFDFNGDGFMNRVYAGDLGGQMFAFEDDNKDGTWSKRRLFEAPVTGDNRKKIFYAPDAVKESFGEIVFFGTGDRADPRETDVENRLYAIKNDWEDVGSFTTLTESDLVDVTDDLIQMGTSEEKAQVEDDLENSKGWYIRLENSGEKVVSTPTVFGGVVYFTTYTPEPEGGGGDPEDPCIASEARGKARLYGLNYLTGGGVHKEWSTEVETDAEGNVVDAGKLDRVKEIGTAIPSAPVIAMLEGGPKMYIGVEGGVIPEDAVPTTDVHIFYWRQIF